MNPDVRPLTLCEGRPKLSRERVRLALPPQRNPRQWRCATGSEATIERKAAMYLKRFKYEAAAKFDYPEFTLAKVVCNLRKYYKQSRQGTIRLVRGIFNPKCGIDWSSEGIGITWDLVEPYTPSLGLSNRAAVKRSDRDHLYEAVVDFVLLLEPGGRALTTDLFRLFLLLNPDVHPLPTDDAFGIAFGDVTCRTSRPSKGKRYYSGVRIPNHLRRLLDS